MKASDLLTQNFPPKILIYGAAGTGKTALVSQASKGYLMDFDTGMLSSAHLKDQYFDQRNAIEFDDFSEPNPQKPAAWLAAKRKLIEIVDACNRDAWEYDCLVIDSLSGMAEVIQNQILHSCKKTMGMPEIREWGLIVSELESALQLIRSLPCLVLVTAHELPIEVDGEVIMKIPAPGRKLPAKIPAWFDEVWYARARRGQANSINYIVSGRKTSAIEARTRSGMTGDITHNEIGLVGVLEQIGYHYNKEKNNVTN